MASESQNSTVGCDTHAKTATIKSPPMQKWSPSGLLQQFSKDQPAPPSEGRPSSSLSRSSQGPSSGSLSQNSERSVQSTSTSSTPPKELPGLFYEADSEDLFVLIGDMLSQLMAHNDNIPLHPSDLTRFHSRATPGISIGSYLRRMAKYTTLDKPCLLLILVYIDRVCERLSGFTICSLTVHRFVCASVVCASKALCDSFSTNRHYARVGGISLTELNLLEKEFLNVIDWRLVASAPVMQHYYVSLVQMHSSFILEASTKPMPDAFTGTPPSTNKKTL